MPSPWSNPFPPFVELTDSRYGRMLYPFEDQYVGRSFKEYGEFSEEEIIIFRQFVGPGFVVLDVGANIGAHTIPLAQLTGPEGLVVAFEPQRILHQILCANLALNNITNTLAYATALGDQPSTCMLPILDYTSSSNFGGISVSMAGGGDIVVMETLDGFQLQRVDFIKLDVEGYERNVLMGGAETIKRCRPVLYVENDRPQHSEALIQWILDMDYRLWWHFPLLFNSANYKANPENHFPQTMSVNMLCIHRDQKPFSGLDEITTAKDWWQ